MSIAFWNSRAIEPLEWGNRAANLGTRYHQSSSWKAVGKSWGGGGKENHLKKCLTCDVNHPRFVFLLRRLPVSQRAEDNWSKSEVICKRLGRRIE